MTTVALSAQKLLWQGLGVEIGSKNHEDALRITGLDYEVEKAKQTSVDLIQPTLKGLPALHLTNHLADMTYRTDTCAVLGNVGPGYEIIQNRETFEFLETLIGEEGGQATMHSASSFFNGREVWCAVDMGKPFDVGKHSLRCFVLMTWGHDGLHCWTAKFMCVNADTGAMLFAKPKGVKTEFKIRHTKRAADRIKEAGRTLAAAHKYFREAQHSFDVLALEPITTAGVHEIIKSLFPESDSDRANTRRENERAKLLDIINNGPGQKAASGTCWSVFHGVALYETFDSATRAGRIKNEGEARLHGQLFSPNAGKLTIDAFNLLMEKIS